MRREMVRLPSSYALVATVYGVIAREPGEDVWLWSGTCQRILPVVKREPSVSDPVVATVLVRASALDVLVGALSDELDDELVFS